MRCRKKKDRGVSVVRQRRRKEKDLGFQIVREKLRRKESTIRCKQGGEKEGRKAREV